MSSKFAGVTLHKMTGRWQAGANGKYLGLCESEELAAEARQKYLREKLEPPNQSTPEKNCVPSRKSKVHRTPEQPKLQEQVPNAKMPSSVAMDFLDKFKHQHDDDFAASLVSPARHDVSSFRSAELAHTTPERVGHQNMASRLPMEEVSKITFDRTCFFQCYSYSHVDDVVLHHFCSCTSWDT